jgi:hypothetical protein
VCEVQVHLAAVLVLKEDSHLYYEHFRKAFKGSDAYESRMAMLERVGGADSPEQLVEETLKGADVPKMEAFAQLLGPEMLGAYAVQAVVLRRLIQLDEAASGRRSRRPLVRRAELGHALHNGSRYREAEQVLQPVVAVCTAELGADDVDTLRCTYELGWVVYRLGRLADAEPLARRAVEGREAALGADHMETLQAMNVLACVVEDLPGRLEEGEVLHRRTLAAKERALGWDHGETIKSVNNLANNLALQGRHTEAEPLRRRVLEGRATALGENHPLTLTASRSLADCCLDDLVAGTARGGGGDAT